MNQSSLNNIDNPGYPNLSRVGSYVGDNAFGSCNFRSNTISGGNFQPNYIQSNYNRSTTMVQHNIKPQMDDDIIFPKFTNNSIAGGNIYDKLGIGSGRSNKSLVNISNTVITPHVNVFDDIPSLDDVVKYNSSNNINDNLFVAKNVMNDSLFCSPSPPVPGMISKDYSQYSNTKWYNNLLTSKNPIFIKHGSTQVYKYNKEKQTFENIINDEFSLLVFPKYHRYTELPDNSYLVTGGEFNGITLDTCSVITKKLFVEEKKNMYTCRKAHSTAFISGKPK
jgi:hypothetical protein